MAIGKVHLERGNAAVTPQRVNIIVVQQLERSILNVKILRLILQRTKSIFMR
jgi:hypothetical protein